MADKLRLVLTFKQEEKWLLDEINKHSGKGNWIKDVLTEKLRAENSAKKDIK